MPLSIFFMSVGSLSLIRDICMVNIAETTLLSFAAGMFLFVFALMSEQMAILRRELMEKDLL